jgi:hypothetical protein
MTSDIAWSGADCTPGVTPRQLVQSSSENDNSNGNLNWLGHFWLLKLPMQHEMLAVWRHCYTMGALIALDGDIPNGKRECKKSAR